MAYFDNNATTRPSPEVQAAFDQALRESWVNPSSPCRSGGAVRARLNQARESIARSLEVDAGRVVFTSGATEANNAVFAHSARLLEPSDRALVSSIEHPSVLSPADYWFAERVQSVPVDPTGVIDFRHLSVLLDEASEIRLVSLMAATNETGVLQPWREVAVLCRERGIHFHCDATQWIGKFPSSEFSACSSFSASAHKFGGPKGVGVLVSELAMPFIFGGSQENGRRSGTENYPAIKAMSVACELISRRLSDLPARSYWRDSFEECMLTDFPGLQILGKEVPRLWNTSMLLMPDHENLRYVGKLDKLGFEVSTGSACSIGKEEISSVPLAMGFSPEQTKRLVRVSSYTEHTESDWMSLATAFCDARDELDQDSVGSSVISP
jgi:cysteine desulfurase